MEKHQRVLPGVPELDDERLPECCFHAPSLQWDRPGGELAIVRGHRHLERLA